MLKTSGCAFSISSNSTTENGLRRTASVSWPQREDVDHAVAVVLPRVDDQLLIPRGIAAADLTRLAQVQERGRAIYPGAALNKAIEGEVVVTFNVANDGSVVRAQIERAWPAGVFDQAALRAVRNTRYAAISNGQLSRSLQVQRQFRFRLRDG